MPIAPMKLLHMNGYVIEKTFLYAIVAMTKWLGEDFTCGVYETGSRSLQLI